MVSNATTAACAMYARTDKTGGTTHVAALEMTASAIATWLAAHPSQNLVVGVDTLRIDADAVWPINTAVIIVARQLTSTGTSKVTVATDNALASVSVCTGAVQGDISVAWQDASGAGVGSPQPLHTGGTGAWIYEIKRGESVTAQVATPQMLAQYLDTPTALNGLKSGFCGGATMAYDESTAAEAAAILQWVADGTKASVEHGTRTRDALLEANALYNQSIALLVYARAKAAGVTVVPVLSSTYYADRVEALLGVADVYQQDIDQLNIVSNQEHVLAKFAAALERTTANTEKPLQDEMDAYTKDYENLYNDYLKLLGLMDVQRGIIDADKEALDEAIKKAEIMEYISGVIDVIGSIMDAAKAVGEFAADDYSGAAGDAIGAIQKGVSALDKFNDNTLPDFKSAADGLAANLTIGASIGENAFKVWKAVEYQGGKVSFKAAEDLAQQLDDSSLAGDPALPWKLLGQKAAATLEPAKGQKYIGGPAMAYEAALEVLVTYGEAMAAKQVALARGAYTLADTAGRLLAVQNNESVWASLAQEITDKERLLAAQIGFVKDRALNVTRSLYVALEYYRAAYAYFFLQLCPTSIALDMDYSQLAAALSGVSASVGDLISPTSTVLQDYDGRDFSIQVIGDVAFTDGSATFSISIDDAAFVNGLTASHSQAVYVGCVEFFLYPEPTDGTVVQLEVGTSGVYDLAPASGQVQQFVCVHPFDLDVEYTWNGNGSYQYSTAWEPSRLVSAYYMKPSPFTQWTVKVSDPALVAGAQRIDMKLSGTYWDKR